MSEASAASGEFVLMHVNVCREKGFSSIQRLWRSGTNWTFRFVSSDALKGCWGPMDGQLACKQQRPYSDQRFEWRDLMRSGLSSVKKHIEKERTGGWWKCIIHERRKESRVSAGVVCPWLPVLIFHTEVIVFMRRMCVYLSDFSLLVGSQMDFPDGLMTLLQMFRLALPFVEVREYKRVV